uniref:Uncharacterized protein n=1 Tax=Xiphophorus maculatus TaxID=8083 RepID=A0A3B5R0B7_XIPMA
MQQVNILPSNQENLQENRELKERLMVSEATVHAQAEQLKDYRDLLSEFVISTVACAHILRSRCANIKKRAHLWHLEPPTALIV